MFDYSSGEILNEISLSLTGKDLTPDELEHYMSFDKKARVNNLIADTLKKQEFKKLFLSESGLKFDLVRDIYKALLLRLPEEEAIINYTEVLVNDGLEGLLSGVIASDEFSRKYLEGPDPSSFPHPAEKYDEELTFFLHVPKCAGTSLYEMLKSAFGVENISHQFIFLRTRPNSWVNKYQLIAGHVDYDEIMMLVPRKKKIIFTILRDPVKRLISLYNFWKSHDKDVNLEMENLIAANENDITEFFSNPYFIEKFNLWNEMTFFIMGFSIWNSWKSIYMNMSEDELESFLEREVRPTVSKRLKEFIFVGIQEDFERSTQILFSILEKPWPGIAKSNVTETNLEKFGFRKDFVREEITKEAQGLMENITRIDKIIYQEGKKIYEEFLLNYR
jgi:hypothetical protein